MHVSGTFPLPAAGSRDQAVFVFQRRAAARTSDGDAP
jgi:hypothetical protein